MTSTATHTDRLLELDADVRSAWSAYRVRLRELTGEEYEETEADAWGELQCELHRIRLARDELGVAAAPPREVR